jgi:hypothetical protein
MESIPYCTNTLNPGYTMEYLYQFLVTISALIIVKLAPEYFLKYIGKKGENLATQEDIGNITREIESVKTEIARASSIEDTKRSIKHDACLEALSIIDAFLSHNVAGDIEKQNKEIYKAREAHTKLILACDNPDIIATFLNIIFYASRPNAPVAPLTDQLNDLRNLIRQELGFGDRLELDRDVAWIGKTNFSTPTHA